MKNMKYLDYEQPAVEIITVQVEHGFQASKGEGFDPADFTPGEEDWF